MSKKNKIIMTLLMALMALNFQGWVMPNNPWFDPSQPRDIRGRWTRIAEAARKAAELGDTGSDQGGRRPLGRHTLEFEDLGIRWSGAWTLEDEAQFLKEVRLTADKVGGADNFRKIFGDMNVNLKLTEDGLRSCWSWMTCYNGIKLTEDSDNYGILLHEMGHRFLNNLELRDYEYSIGYHDENGEYVHVSGYNPETKKHERTSLGYPNEGYPYEQHPASANPSKLEDFADMFMNWVRGSFSDDPAGQARQEFMDEFIADAIERMNENDQ